MDSRKHHNEKLQNLYSSEKYYFQVKEQEIGGHVTSVENSRNVRKRFVKKHKGVYLEYPGVDGWLILKYILKKYNMKLYSGLN